MSMCEISRKMRGPAVAGVAVGDGVFRAKGQVMSERQRWSIPAETLATVPDAMRQIVESGESSSRDRVAAAKVLVAMVAHNAGVPAVAVSVSGGEHVAGMVRAMLNEPRYLSFLHSRGVG